MCVRAC
jgi:hypothetical protein